MKKNKKGFTLLELLAVIVILAIIALIATPIALNMINNAKKSAAVDSAYGYIKAIEYNNTMAEMNKKYTKIEDTTTEEGIPVSQINVKVKGTKPNGGKVKITKGRVSYADLCINSYKVIYDGSKAAVKGSDCAAEIVEINSKDVSFTPSDSNWKVSTVEEALDSLYGE